MSPYGYDLPADMFGTLKTRQLYVQIGRRVYRRGRGIFYTIHPSARVMNRAFWRRRNKRTKVSPSHARFARRQRVRVPIVAAVTCDVLTLVVGCEPMSEPLKGWYGPAY